METVSDGCPTGILIDIGLQTKVSNNIKENEDQISIKNKKDKNIVAGTNSSHPCSYRTSNCFLDQTPPKPPSILKKSVFFTPKSIWKTPSPKSMKIISRDASRIVDQLYSSPINCSEVMISDEVFPTVKSLDDASFDEIHIKSRSQPATDMTVSHEKVDHDNLNSFDMTKCPISAVSTCTSECVVVSDEKLSTIVLQSDVKPGKEHDSISEKIMDPMTPENVSSQKSNTESIVSDKETIESVTCNVNSNPAILECITVLNEQLLAPEHEVTTHKKLPAVAKGFGFKKSMKHCSEKNKENEHQSNGTIQAKFGPRFSKIENSCSSIENGTNRTNTIKNQNVKDQQSLKVEQSSTKYITAKYSLLEKKKPKESKNLEDHISKSMIGKPKILQQKSNVERSQSLLYKKDPLCKTATSLKTPIVESSVRRFHSFHDGSTRNAIPKVEKKFIPTTESCCRVWKPKKSLNQVPNGNEFSTPMQFGRYSQSFKLTDSSSANPMQRKSLAFNSNYPLVASGIKIAAQKDQHSISKKPAVTSSSRLGFGKKLSISSSYPKIKNDSLPRKLFP